MAADLNSIISELDAAYSPSRQAINDRINGLQGAESADVAGLEAQKNTAFDDITNGARSRGMGFSGIPLQEQAKYTASSFLPAVAKVKQSYSEGRNGLVDALNNMNIDQRKTAMSIRETQQNRDFEAEQARLQREAAARAQSGSGDALASLFGGASTAAAGKPDAFATLGNQKQQAATAMVGLLKTNDPATIQKTIQAIQSSASKGNLYDKYKLELLNNYKQTQYGSLINKALSYKPAISQPVAGRATTITVPGSSVNQHPNIGLR